MSDAEIFGDDWGGAAKRLSAKGFKTEKERIAFEIGFAGGCVYVQQKVESWFRKMITKHSKPDATEKGDEK